MRESSDLTTSCITNLLGRNRGMLVANNSDHGSETIVKGIDLPAKTERIRSRTDR